MRVTQADAYVEPRDSISWDWIRCLEARGVETILIPNALSDPVGFLEIYSPDLVIMTGGDDLGRHEERDDTEQAILTHAISGALPVFGVCRGMQLINQYFGGKVTQIKGHVATDHHIYPKPPFEEQYGCEKIVNSFHSLAIKPADLGTELDGFAVDSDGNIEGFYHQKYPIAAVMWHPERRGDNKVDFWLMEQLANRKGGQP